MRGFAIIDDEMYYKRLDGTYAKMPEDNPEAMARIIIDRLSPEELRNCIRILVDAGMERDRQQMMELVTYYA